MPQSLPRTLKIDVEALSQMFLTRRRTKPRFKLDMLPEQAADLITAAYRSECMFRGCNPIIDEPTANHIQRAAAWLTADNPKFGMLFCGKCGNGKTTLVRAIQAVIKYLYQNDLPKDQCYLRMVDSKEICAVSKRDYNEFKRLAHTDLLAIDDLGIEPVEVLDYGNVLNPVIDLLYIRYDEQLTTIITTNLTPQQIRKTYGDRIADRFNEMMDRIIFNNKTYRL